MRDGNLGKKLRNILASGHKGIIIHRTDTGLVNWINVWAPEYAHQHQIFEFGLKLHIDPKRRSNSLNHVGALSLRKILPLIFSSKLAEDETMATHVNFEPDRSNEFVADSRRSSDRAAVASEIFIRQSDTQLFRTILSDLSITGFKMQSFTSLDEDKLVFVTLPGLQTLGAHIRWVHYQDFGCEFTSPLHPAVLDHIVSVLRKI